MGIQRLLTRLFGHRYQPTMYEQCGAIYRNLLRLGQNNSAAQLYLDAAKDALLLATIVLRDDDNKGLTQRTKKQPAYGRSMKN
jgi:hypothetical protein